MRLTYTELHAPIDGVVDVRAARTGEVVTPGQPVLSLINPDDLWVRADVEETYIDGVRIGDTLTVRLPSGEEREGRVFYRGVDAAFARWSKDLEAANQLVCDHPQQELAVQLDCLADRSREALFITPAYPVNALTDPTGAGDSFAGGFLGWLAHCGTVDAHSIQQALACGTAMASIAIEDFSPRRLAETTRKEIAERVELLHRMVSFELRPFE